MGTRSNDQPENDPRRFVGIMRAGLRTRLHRLFSTSEERKSTVRREIIEGSAPDIRYYLLMAIASLIAAVGLVTSSPAVIIGAMLIAPLMTPSFGLALGLVNGNAALMRRALLGELRSVILAIGMSALFGMLPLPLHITHEMLMRTQPTLLDLGVAILAGFAGCLAFIDEKASPVFPGIAIATSLVPPLATSGLCLVLGAPHGALGSFLLYFSNFLVILIVSGALFVGAGFVSRLEIDSRLRLISRFSVTVLSVVAVGILLTQTLLSSIEKIQIKEKIESILNEEIASEPATSLQEVLFKQQSDTLAVLTTIRTPRPLSPGKVKDMEEKIARALARRVQLITRCEIVRDVSATGTTSIGTDENLDGNFTTNQLHPRVRKIQLAEQAFREVLDRFPGVYLRDLDLIDLEGTSVILATIESSRAVGHQSVQRMEKFIQERLADPAVRLLIRSQELVGVTGKGRVLYGEAHFGAYTPEDQSVQAQLEQLVRQHITALQDTFAVNVDAKRDGSQWSIRAEVVGSRVLRPGEVQQIEQDITAASGEKIRLEAWSRIEVLVTGERYRPLRAPEMDK